jgi:hypothetical protein
MKNEEIPLPPFSRGEIENRTIDLSKNLCDSCQYEFYLSCPGTREGNIEFAGQWDYQMQIQGNPKANNVVVCDLHTQKDIKDNKGEDDEDEGYQTTQRIEGGH